MPDTSTEVAIATTTLSSAAATITFSSIPATYTDLRLVLVGTSTSATPSIHVRFNSDSGTNYSYTILYGDGTSAASSRGTNSNSVYAAQWSGLSSTVPTFFTVDIFSYAGSTNKSCLVEGSFDKNGSGTVERMIGLWRNTAAINTVSFTTSTSTLAIGTTATLYGIL